MITACNTTIVKEEEVDVRQTIMMDGSFTTKSIMMVSTSDQSFLVDGQSILPSVVKIKSYYDIKDKNFKEDFYKRELCTEHNCFLIIDYAWGDYE